jgi:hypothetical protein
MQNLHLLYSLLFLVIKKIKADKVMNGGQGIVKMEHKVSDCMWGSSC